MSYGNDWDNVPSTKGTPYPPISWKWEHVKKRIASLPGWILFLSFLIFALIFPCRGRCRDD